MISYTVFCCQNDEFRVENLYITFFGIKVKKRYAQNPHISLKNNSTTKIEADTPKIGDTPALKASLFTDIQPLQSILTAIHTRPISSS